MTHTPTPLINADHRFFAQSAGAYETGQYVLATDRNLEEVRRSMAVDDQANDLTAGCVTWAIWDDDDQRGQMTVWPNGRGAISTGGSSEWGDWDSQACELTTDDPHITYDADGDIVDEPGEAQP